MCKTLATECVVSYRTRAHCLPTAAVARGRTGRSTSAAAVAHSTLRAIQPATCAHGSLQPPGWSCCRYEGGDKVSQVMREVDQVKGVMSDNINQAMSNLESTEALNEKTQEMKAQSNMFNKQAKTAKNQMWWKNMKLNIIIAAVVIIIVASMVSSFWPS